MTEVVVISGKGGTGKTSIVAALAALAQPVALADCDVDAPDLYLLAQPRPYKTVHFSGGSKAEILTDRCLGCSACADACRFHAISAADGSTAGVHQVDPLACEGCGACVPVCPQQAIRLRPVENGLWFVSQTRFGPMVHARLQPGEDNCGKLVSTVRREAREVAEREELELLLSDGSPGVGCPVIASLSHAGLALIVAEPTLSGLHDARRVLQLAAQLRVPAALCINRWDLNPQLTDELESAAASLGAATIGRVRQDLALANAQLAERSLVELTEAGASADLRRLWERLRHLVRRPALRGSAAPSVADAVMPAQPPDQLPMRGDAP